MRLSNRYFKSILAFLGVMLFLSQAMAQDGQIYKWNGRNWDRVNNGRGVSISVGSDGSPWVINSYNEVLTRRRNSWDKINGAQGNDIGAGNDGSIWLVGTNEVANGDFEIYRRVNNNRWERMPGGGVRIAAESRNSAWLVNSANAIWRFVRNDWRQIDGEAYDIGVGNDGSVWVVGTRSVGNAGDYGILRRRGNKWEEMPGGGIRIAVESTNTAWLVNSDGVIWKFVNNDWQRMPGRGQDIGVGSDGTVWMIGTP